LKKKKTVASVADVARTEPETETGTGAEPTDVKTAGVKDPAELRRRMDDIKNEMVAVAEQMVEMERRLLEQQADLEARQTRLEKDGLGASDGYLAEEADRKG